MADRARAAMTESVELLRDALHNRCRAVSLTHCDAPDGHTIEAINAIAALRSLPVEQRMEAMGMVQRNYFVNGGATVWVEP